MPTWHTAASHTSPGTRNVAQTQVPSRPFGTTPAMWHSPRCPQAHLAQSPPPPRACGGSLSAHQPPPTWHKASHHRALVAGVLLKHQPQRPGEGDSDQLAGLGQYLRQREGGWGWGGGGAWH